MSSTFEPRQVAAEEFADVSGADRVPDFGSWAARYSGDTGHTLNYIDVLIIGDSTDRAGLRAAGDRALLRLGIPVNPVMRTRQLWEYPSDRLSAQVRAQPLADVTTDPV